MDAMLKYPKFYPYVGKMFPFVGHRNQFKLCLKKIECILSVSFLDIICQLISLNFPKEYLRQWIHKSVPKIV